MTVCVFANNNYGRHWRRKDGTRKGNTKFRHFIDEPMTAQVPIREFLIIKNSGRWWPQRGNRYINACSGNFTLQLQKQSPGDGAIGQSQHKAKSSTRAKRCMEGILALYLIQKIRRKFTFSPKYKTGRCA